MRAGAPRPYAGTALAKERGRAALECARREAAGGPPALLRLRALRAAGRAGTTLVPRTGEPPAAAGG